MTDAGTGRTRICLYDARRPDVASFKDAWPPIRWLCPKIPLMLAANAPPQASDGKRTAGIMVRIIFAAVGLGLMLTAAQAVELKLLASNALKSVLQEVAPQFEQASGHKLAITFGSTGNLTASIDKGTPFDVTIMGADGLDNLIKRGALAGPRLDLARSGIGVPSRQGAP